jgi:hypothetical protein
MALTVSPVAGAHYVAGNKKVRVLDVTFDDNYPTGGESLTAADCGLRTIQQVIPNGPAADSDGTGGANSVDVRYDYSTAKLQAFEGGGAGAVNPEKGSTESLAAYLVRLTVVGY